MNTYSRQQTQRLVLLAIFSAIITLQSWVPMLGYIALPTISLTIIHITVIIFALLMPTRDAVILGFVWGLNSLLRALFLGSPIEKIIFASPLISLIPRMLMPLCLGALNQWMVKRNLTLRFRTMIAGFSGSMMNTVFVLGAIGLFKAVPYLELAGAATNVNIWGILGAIVVANGIPEALVSTVLTPLIAIPLERYLYRRR